MNIKNIVKQVINEYSYEKRLPFPEDEFKNKNYLEQYKDWLEDFGKYGTLPPSQLDFWEEIKKAIQYIIDNNLTNKLGHGLRLDANVEEIYHELMEIMGETLHFATNNKLYVERQVIIDDTASTYDHSDISGNDPTILYNNLVDTYQNNVGGCWSYKLNGSMSYCTLSGGDTITLKGYIRYEDIDFVKTVLLNFHYPEEYEIRVKPKAQIELFEVNFNCKYKIPLKDHLIVTATYFGNNSGYVNDYATVDDGFGHYQYMDRQGNIKDPISVVKDQMNKGIPFEKIFNKYFVLTNGFKLVLLNNKVSYINNDNHLIGNGNLWFDDGNKFYENFAKVKLNNKYSFINTNGELIGNGNLWFDDADDFDDGFAKVILHNKCSLLNSNERLIGNGNLWFDDIDYFYDGFAKVELNNKYSFINTNGELIGNGNLWFDVANTFYDNFSVVMKNHKYSYLMSNGELIGNGDLWFDDADDFDDGFAEVLLYNKWYIIDEQGNFYDIDTKKPIPNPIYRTNENIIPKRLLHYLNEGRNEDKARKKTLNIITDFFQFNNKSTLYTSTNINSIEHDFRYDFFGTNVSDAVIRLEPIMMNIALNLGYKQDNTDNKKIDNLKKIISYIKQCYKEKDFPISLNQLTLQNTSYDKLVQLFSSPMNKRLEQDEMLSNKFANNTQMNPSYEIINIESFEDAQKYGEYSCSKSPLCYCTSKSKWNQFTFDGENKVYLILNKNWKNIQEKYGQNHPYDEYGLSMIFVFINPEGNIAYSNTRWNHGTKEHIHNVDNSFTKTQISNLLGVNFNSIFKPYTDQELYSKGYYTIPIVRKLLKNGVPADDIFEEYYPFNEKWMIAAYRCNLGTLYCPSTNQILDTYDHWFTVIQPIKNNPLSRVKNDNEKFSFINNDGQLLYNGQLWFDNADNFKDGYANVSISNQLYTIDMHGNFYDYNTKKPIPNPLDNKQNETHFLLKKIINEEINKFILTENFDDNFGEYGELVYIKYNILKETDDEGYESEEYKIIEFMTLKGDIYKPNEICSYYELPDYFGQDVAFEMEDYECNENNLINHYKQDDNDVLEYSCYLQLNDIDNLRNTDPIGLLEKTYGTTDNFESAIWLLPNGTLLNGDEGNGYRTIDHNSVEGLLQMSCDQVMD